MRKSYPAVNDVLAEFEQKYKDLVAYDRRLDANRQKVYEVLDEYDAPLYSFQISQMTGLNRDEVKEALSQLIYLDRVVATGIEGVNFSSVTQNYTIQRN